MLKKSYTQQIEDIQGTKLLVLPHDNNQENETVYNDYSILVDGYRGDIKEKEVAYPSTNVDNGDQKLDIGQVGYRSNIDGFNPSNYPWDKKYDTVSKDGDEYGHPYKLDYGYPTRRNLYSSIHGREVNTPERWNNSKDDSVYYPSSMSRAIDGYPYYWDVPFGNDDEDRAHGNDLNISETRNTGPNARVISYTSDSYPDNIGKFASLSLRGVLRGLNKDIIKASSSVKVGSHKLLSSGIDGGGRHYATILFSVTGSRNKNVSRKKRKSGYEVRVKVFLDGNRLDSDGDLVDDRIKLDSRDEIEIRCSCNGWLYNGSDYLSHTDGYSFGTSRGIGGKPSAPNTTVYPYKAGSRVCKHAYSVLSWMTKNDFDVI